MRLFELPHQLCPGGKPAIAALVERPNPKTVSHSIYIAQNDDLTSYAFLANNNRFAQRGVLTTDYPETNTIDQLKGATVQLTGPDIYIDEQTLFAALSNRLLCIINGEICSVIEAQLVAPATFRLLLVRGRFGTERAEHEAGSEVYLLPYSSLLTLQHELMQPGNTVTLKITAASPDEADDLADVDPIDLTLVGRMINLPAPSLLAVDGITRNAFYNQVDPFDITWILPQVAGLDMSRTYTLLEFIEGVDVIHTQKVYWPLSTLEFDYPPVAPVTFILRASMVVETDWETITGPSTQLTVNATGAT